MSSACLQARGLEEDRFGGRVQGVVTRAGSRESGICGSHLSSTATKFCGFLDGKLDSPLTLLALDVV